MALESLSNPLQALGAQPYVMNLRSQNAVTNEVTWDAATQYFINDVVRSPLTGGMYVYEAWDPITGDNTPSCIVSANDPSSAGGRADGWAPCQGNGLLNVALTTAVVAGTAGTPAPAGPLTVPLGLGYTLAAAGGLGEVSVWLVKLDYSVIITANAATAGTEFLNWTFTPTGTGAAPVVSTQAFGTANGTVATGPLGSTVSVVVTVPADGTSIGVAGYQSATSAPLVFSNVVATYSRLR
jgi:hypothetical protein